jgi:hypothetical protein
MIIAEVGEALRTRPKSHWIGLGRSPDRLIA